MAVPVFPVVISSPSDHGGSKSVFFLSNKGQHVGPSVAASIFCDVHGSPAVFFLVQSESKCWAAHASPSGAITGT